MSQGGSGVMRGTVVRAEFDGLPGKPLTRRERQVLGLAGTGLSQKEVAYRLGVTSHTVKQHLYRAYAKLGAHNLVDSLRVLGWLGVGCRYCQQVVPVDAAGTIAMHEQVIFGTAGPARWSRAIRCNGSGTAVDDDLEAAERRQP